MKEYARGDAVMVTPIGGELPEPYFAIVYSNFGRDTLEVRANGTIFTVKKSQVTRLEDRKNLSEKTNDNG